jgi:hypothetical protein
VTTTVAATAVAATTPVQVAAVAAATTQVPVAAVAAAGTTEATHTTEAPPEQAKAQT